MSKPYVGVVVDLVDPYLTPEVKNIGGFKSLTENDGNYPVWWMRQNPGRWALVGDGGVGLTRTMLKIFPEIEVKEQGKYESKTKAWARTKTFARIPHPECESFAEALARREIEPKLYLPEVTRDEFDWTPAELAEACRVARDNLFPTGA